MQKLSFDSINTFCIKTKQIPFLLSIQNPRDSRLLDFNPVALFGDKKLTEQFFGKQLEPKMIFEGRDLLEKIVDAYEIAFKQAEEKQFINEQHCEFYGHIVFVTQDWFYWKAICLDANTVYNSYMTSEPLKVYFDELDLTDELLAGRSHEKP